jgi:hypothetical protein
MYEFAVQPEFMTRGMSTLSTTPRLEACVAHDVPDSVSGNVLVCALGYFGGLVPSLRLSGLVDSTSLLLNNKALDPFGLIDNCDTY